VDLVDPNGCARLAETLKGKRCGISKSLLRTGARDIIGAGGTLGYQKERQKDSKRTKFWRQDGMIQWDQIIGIGSV